MLKKNRSLTNTPEFMYASQNIYATKILHPEIKPHLPSPPSSIINKPNKKGKNWCSRFIFIFIEVN